MYYSSMKHCNLQAIYLPPDKITLIVEFFCPNLVWAPTPYTASHFV